VQSETIGERLKRLRLERRLSQRELAAPGVSYAYISRIEAGTRQPSVKALRRLAAKLQVTPEYLETGSDLDAAEQLELRLADLELAVRLDSGEATEEPLRALVAEAKAAGNAEVTFRGLVALASLAQVRGEHRVAADLLETTIADYRPSPLEHFDVYAELGRAYAGSGDPERAAKLYERCLEEVRSSADPPTATTEIRYATLLSYALSDAGELSRAEQVVRETLERAGDSADSYMRVRLYWSLARLAHAESKPAVALAHARKAIALLEATEDTINLARANLLAASIMITRTDAEQASLHLDTAESLLGATASFTDAVMLRVKRAQVAALRGSGAEAVRLAREAVEMIGDEPLDELGSAFFALAEGLVLEGEEQGADEAFRRAVDLLERHNQWREATTACRAWARMLRAAGREDQALDVLDRAAELGLRATPSQAQTAER
jgi:transcriptional regulator with XRE-family HTH domain